MREHGPASRLCLLAAACISAFGCNDRPATELIALRVRGTTRPLVAAAISYEPVQDVVSARVSAQGSLMIERKRSENALTVRVPELCPVRIPPGRHGEITELRPVIDLGGDRAPLGFDAAFTIKPVHGCPERGRGQIRWRQLEGLPLGALSVSDDGFALTARTPRLEQAHPEPFPAGIVPFSPRTQGRVVLEASWQGPGLPPVTRTVTIRATSRATGLSSVAVSQQLMLSGSGLHVKSAPQGGHAQAHARGALFEFTPDVHGRWVLADDAGQERVLQAFWHDKTPYDCGRSECHAAIASHAVDSPMSRALQAPLEAKTPGANGCMLECHVTGERGSDDGGFLDVAGELGFTWLESSSWQDLPQPLRRLGGVRCTACHGPGAIPEPDARADVLRADVCATCHDAPPRYELVQQWRASRMARSDAASATREAACASCHTTGGFLDSIGARSKPSAAQHAEPVGIACAACHAPHAAHSGARLLRAVPASDPPLEPRTAVCMRCHSPIEGETSPSAASAALWLGRVRVPALEQDATELLAIPSVHRNVPGGCVGCHGARPAGESSKLDHSFRVDPRTCTGCHDAEQPARTQALQRSLQLRAQVLAQRLAVDCPNAERMHHDAATTVERCATPQLSRARYEIALALEDPAAAIHNGAFARSLLDDAERQLQPGLVPAD